MFFDIEEVENRVEVQSNKENQKNKITRLKIIGLIG